MVAAILGHLIIMNWCFPFKEAITKAPIINYDHPFHQERSMDRASYISDGKTIWGYNPRLMAGYIDGIIALNDGFTHWLNSIIKDACGRYTVYKLWIVFSLILPIITVPLAVSLFGFKKIWPLSIILTVILMDSNTEIRNFYLYGMVPFVVANFISLLSVAAFWAYTQERSYRSFLLVILLLPVSFLMHPLSFFLEIFCFGIIFLGTFRSYKIREWIHIILLISVVFLVNWHWIKVFIDFHSFTAPGADFFFRSHPLKFIRDYFIDIKNLPSIWIAIAGICGLWILQAQRPDHRLLYLAFFAGIFSLFLVTYFGNLLGLGWIQPYRFSISLPIFFLAPATYAINYFWKWGRSAISWNLLKLLPIFLVLCPVFGYHVYRNYENRVINFGAGKIKRLTTVIPPDLKWMIAWIKTNTVANARVAIQEVGAVPPIGGSHFMSLVAFQTGREIIGNYHYKAHTIYGAVAVNEKFIGIPFDLLTKGKLQDICEQYNIHTIILHDDSAQETMRHLWPLARSIASHGQLEVFRINIKPSFFVRGTGELVSDLNHIMVRNATSTVTIIKYHYFKLLKTSPPLQINRYPIQYDPIGFIEIRNGDIRNFEIYVDYDSAAKLSGP